jgi:methyl-accepting chemotaxis protein
MSASLPTGRSFIQKILTYTGIYAALACVVISLYLSGLLRLTTQQWQGFFQIVAGVFVLIFPAMNLVHRRVLRRIQRCLDQLATGSPHPGQLQRGFAAIVDFPRYWFVWGLMWWGLGGAAVGGAMCLRYDDFTLRSAFVILCATISAAFITDIYYYLTVKRFLAPARAALAAEIGAPHLRAPLIHRVSLRTKLMAATTSVILVTAVFASLLSQVRSERAVEDHTLQLQQRILAALTLRQDLSFTDAAAELGALGQPVELLLFDASTQRLIAGKPDALSDSNRARLFDRSNSSGDSSGFDTPRSFSWRPLPDSTGILVAVAPEGSRSHGAGGGAFALLLLFSSLVAVGVAYLMAREVGDATEVLRSGAARIAGGDLRPSAIFESEDELGELAHSFETMTSSLRVTMERVNGAADRMQEASSEIASASHNVADVTQLQVCGIAEATESMGSIDEQVRDIAGSAEQLEQVLDQASSSVMEIAATSDQLSQGANELAVNVDQVASTSEEMSLSIAQVAESSDSLVTSADEVSASMDQAAAGNHEVAKNTDEISRLAGLMSQLSEQGRSHVSETIEAMTAIHTATANANRVIGSLADNTKEIGSVIEVINDVADESGLLALNAAIIAAQAGEHGRSFAVVAEQVKRLAARVSASTKGVAHLIQSVQEQTQETRNTIENSVEIVDRGVMLAGQAGASLEKITHAASESGEQIDAIVETMKNQAEAVSYVANLMESVQGGTGQIRNAIAEQERSTTLLQQSASSSGETANQLRRSTDEQAQSTTAIGRNMESIHQSVGRINKNLKQQSSSCSQAVEVLGQVNLSTESNKQSVQRLQDAMSVLREKSDELREEVARFRV